MRDRDIRHAAALGRLLRNRERGRAAWRSSRIPTRRSSPDWRLCVATTLRLSLSGSYQNPAHLWRSGKSRGDSLSAGTMVTQQFDHGSNPFAVDAIQRPPSIGDCPIIRCPPCALLQQESQRIERFSEARRRNGAVPIRYDASQTASLQAKLRKHVSRTVDPPSDLSLTSAPRVTRYATVSGVVMSDAAAAISSRRSSVAGSGFSRFRIFGSLLRQAIWSADC